MPTASGRRGKYPVLILSGAVLITLLSVAMWAYLEARAVLLAEPVIAVNYRAEFRAYAESVAGVDPQTATRAWHLLAGAAELADQALQEYQDELCKDDPEPRFAGDRCFADYTYVRDSVTLMPDMEREWEALRRLREVGALDKLTEFAGIAPGIIPTGDNSQPIMLQVPPVMAAARGLAHARAASMRLALDNADFENVIQGFDEILAIGRTMVNAPGSLWYLVGSAIQSTAITELHYQLIEADFDAETCRMLLRSLERHRLPSSEFGIEAERALLLDTIQRVYTDDGRGDGYVQPRSFARLVGGDEGDLLTAFRARFRMARRSETTQWLNRWCDMHITPAPREESEVVEAYIESGENVFVSTLAPALGFVRRAHDLNRLHFNGLRLVLLLEIHRDMHGSFPASLDELDSEFDVPIDPIFKRPFAYRLLDDDPYGRPYLLYSLGLDGEDHGGRDVKGGVDRHSVITDRRLIGYDYILNPPRPGVE